MTISAQDLYNFTRCRHRVYLDVHGDRAERSRVSPFVELLWSMGVQAERGYLERLGMDTLEDLGTLTLDETAARTAVLMKEGAALIYQGVIRCDDLVGRPDLLLRRDDMLSVHGRYGYEAVDIKAGHGHDSRDGREGSFKRHYAYQVLFYRLILQTVQHGALPIGRIVNVDGEFESFDVADFLDDFHAALAEVRALHGGTGATEPVLGGRCHQCHWYSHCRRWVEGTHDPTLLFHVGNTKFALKEAGLKTIDDIAALDVAAFLHAGHRIPGMGRTSLERARTRARVRLAGRPEIRPGYVLPAARREVYFDIEDDPTRDVTYLFGWLDRDDAGAWRYHCELARTPAGEERAVRAFWAFVGDSPDTVYYVYSAKERTTLRRLAERYDLDRDVLADYERREFDLYGDLVVRYSDWPAYSYGIKQIASLVGFRWRDENPGGANSIVWYNEWQDDPDNEALLTRILEYNEDDCRAMVAVKEFFERAVGRS